MAAGSSTYSAYAPSPPVTPHQHVADQLPGHALAHLDDLARHLRADHGGQRQRERERARADLGLGVADADGAGTDQDLPGSGSRAGEVAELQVVRLSRGCQDDRAHGCSRLT
ncbi:hypothetical protein GCM10020220_030790 [Nonomuraea rubra]